MGNRRTFRKFRMGRRLTKLIISITVFNCFLLASESYGVLLFPQDARSLSLNNSISANDGPYLQNNPAALSMRSRGITYSYFYLPASIHFGGVQQIRKSNAGIVASKLSFLNYGEIVDSKTEKKSYAFDVLLEMGYKKEIKNIISAGISVGYMFSSITEFHSQLLFSNCGIRSRFLKKRIGIGFSLENVGVLLKSYTDVKEPIPVLFRTAFYYKPIYIPLIISGDIVRQLDEALFNFSGGLELKPDTRFVLRLGGKTNEKIRTFKDFTSHFIAGMSGGVGYNFTKITLDIGLMNLGSSGFIMAFSLTKKLN